MLSLYILVSWSTKFQMSTTAKKSQQLPQKQQQQLTFIVAIIALAVVAAGVFIFFSNNESISGNINYEDLPQSRTADGGFVLGDPDATVTLVEFADFFCPHCQGFKPEINQFIEDFVVTGQAKFEYRFLPTQSSQYSAFAAQLAECVVEQDETGFWEAYDLMFSYASGAGADEEIGRHVADRMGLDYGQLLTCSSSATQVDTDQQLARALEITGTPGMRIRYGDGQPQLLSEQYATGAVPYSVIESVVVGALIEQQ